MVEEGVHTALQELEVVVEEGEPILQSQVVEEEVVVVVGEIPILEVEVEVEECR